jgi:hypothetical protein
MCAVIGTLLKKKIDTFLLKDKATNPALQTGDYSKQTYFNEAPLFQILLFQLKSLTYLENSVTYTQYVSDLLLKIHLSHINEVQNAKISDI